jgi:hypothetical protein
LTYFLSYYYCPNEHRTIGSHQFEIVNMESSSASSPSASSNLLLRKAPTSDRLVTLSIQRGFQDMLIQTTTGVVLGGLAGIVLASRKAPPAVKKILPALGGGLGLGAAWTQTSVHLEQLLAPNLPTTSSKSAPAAPSSSTSL